VIAFEDPDVVHVMGPVDPVPTTTHHQRAGARRSRVVERRLDKARKTAPRDKEAQLELVCWRRVVAELNAGRARAKRARGGRGEGPARSAAHAKPILYAANVNEDDLAAGAANGSATRSACRPP